MTCYTVRLLLCYYCELYVRMHFIPWQLHGVQNYFLLISTSPQFFQNCCTSSDKWPEMFSSVCMWMHLCVRACMYVCLSLTPPFLRNRNALMGQRCPPARRCTQWIYLRHTLKGGRSSYRRFLSDLVHSGHLFSFQTDVMNSIWQHFQWR